MVNVSTHRYCLMCSRNLCKKCMKGWFCPSHAQELLPGEKRKIRVLNGLGKNLMYWAIFTFIGVLFLLGWATGTFTATVANTTLGGTIAGVSLGAAVGVGVLSWYAGTKLLAKAKVAVLGRLNHGQDGQPKNVPAQ
nr:hypothetical protein [Candidatus Sigynarchaeum springense]